MTSEADEYKPSMDEVRDYVTTPKGNSSLARAQAVGDGGWFDAALAAHDREVAARAWDEAQKAIVRELKKVWPKYATPHRVAEQPTNPYRIEED